MNKRQVKKFQKKLCRKTYLGYRLAHINELVKPIVEKYEKEHGEGSAGSTFVYMIDSRRGDLKHLLRVQIFFNCVPAKMKTKME